MELEEKLLELLVSGVDKINFIYINDYISKGLVSGVRPTVQLGNVDDDCDVYYEKLKNGVCNENVYRTAKEYVKLADMGSEYALYNKGGYKPLTLDELQLIYDYTKHRACDSLESERKEYKQDVKSLNEDYFFYNFSIVPDNNGHAILKEE